MGSKAVGLLTFVFGANMAGFDKAMTKATKKLNKFGKNLQKTGKSLSMGLTVPIVGLGAASVKTFADFEQGMLKVKAISGATQKEFQLLTDNAKRLGSETMFTASQVSELQLNLSKLGLTPTQINESTEAILNLAQATDSDLGQAATVAASTMNAFGLEASDMTMITDVMADSFSSTALDLQKFETAMASVAPVANIAGSDLERTTAILGVLTNNGIEASTAGTALRNIFLDLAANGMTWDQAMTKINRSSNKLDTALDLFGKRGSNVATIIANNSTEIQTLTDDFKDSSGEAAEMAAIMDSGVAGAMRRLRSQLEGVAIELGQHLIPLFQQLVAWVSSIASWFSNLSDEQKQSVIRWALIAAAIGPVLIVIGKMSLGVAALINLFKHLKKASGILQTNLKRFPKLIAAAPWIALAGAVFMVARSFFKAKKESGDFNNEKDRINSVREEAAASVAAETLALQTNLKTAQDTTKSDKERLKAVAYLNNTVVEFNKTLNLENIAETNVTNAVNRHTSALKKQAEVRGGFSAADEVAEELARFKAMRPSDIFKDYDLLKEVFDTGTIQLANFSEGWEKFEREINDVIAHTGSDMSKDFADRVRSQWAAHIQEMEDEVDRLLKFSQDAAKEFEEMDVEFFEAETGDAGSVIDLSDVDFGEVEKAKTAMEALSAELKDYKVALEELILAEDGSAEGKEKLNDAAKKVIETQKKLNDAHDRFKELTEEIEEEDPAGAWEKLEEAVSKAEAELQNAIASGVGVKTALDNYNTAQDNLNTKIEEFSKLTKDAEDATEKWKESFKDFGSTASEILSQIGGLISSVAEKEMTEFQNLKLEKEEALEDEYERRRAILRKRFTDEEEFNEALNLLDEEFNQKRDDLAQEQDDKEAAIKTKQAKRAKRLAILEAIVNTATAVVEALPNVILAAFVGAVGAAQIATIASTPIPKFAQGGLAFGPTSAIIGEGANIGAANPEVVAPLSKLKEFIGGGKTEVFGVLKGTDIVLSSQKTNINRLRTI